MEPTQPSVATQKKYDDSESKYAPNLSQPKSCDIKPYRDEISHERKIKVRSIFSKCQGHVLAASLL